MMRRERERESDRKTLLFKRGEMRLSSFLLDANDRFADRRKRKRGRKKKKSSRRRWLFISVT